MSFRRDVAQEQFVYRLKKVATVMLLLANATIINKLVTQKTGLNLFHIIGQALIGKTKLWNEYETIVFLFIATVVILTITILYVFNLIGKHIKNLIERNELRHLSGVKKVEAKQLAKIQTKEVKGDFKIGDIVIPEDLEFRHTIVFGTTGAGKTNQLLQFVETVRKRGDRAVIYDTKQDFIQDFYEEDKDLIFNPVDARGLNWNIFNDLHNYAEVRGFAQSLIPEASANDKYWAEAARQVLESAIFYLMSEDRKSNKDLHEFLHQPPEKIYEDFQKYPSVCSPGIAALADVTEGGKAGLDTLMWLNQYAAFLKLLDDGDFSIYDWVHNGSGFIFVTMRHDVKDVMKPALSVFIDFLATTILSAPDNTLKPTFLFLDEMRTLQKLEAVVNLLALGRSKRTGIFLSNQDVSGLESVYEDKLTATIINNCNTKIVFRLGGTEAEKVAKELSKVKVQKAERSWSAQQSVSTSLNLRESVEDVVHPGEITALDTGECILALKNVVTRVKANRFIHKQRDVKGFILKETLRSDKYVEEGKKKDAERKGDKEDDKPKPKAEPDSVPMPSWADERRLMEELEEFGRYNEPDIESNIIRNPIRPDYRIPPRMHRPIPRKPKVRITDIIRKPKTNRPESPDNDILGDDTWDNVNFNSVDNSNDNANADNNTNTDSNDSSNTGNKKTDVITDLILQ